MPFDIELKSSGSQDDCIRGMFLFPTVLNEDAEILYNLYTERNTNVMEITDIKVPLKFSDQKLAQEVTRCAFSYARKNKYKIKLTGTFATDFLERYPEFQSVALP